MKVFYCNHLQGVWLTAIAAVFAENKEEAAEKVAQALIQEGLEQEVEAKDMIELLPEGGAVVIWNGDY